MFVRMKTGAYAGEVREVKFVTGRELVESGRAEKVDFASGGVITAPPAQKVEEQREKSVVAWPRHKRKKR